MKRQPPLNMGDVFVVDNGDLGITVKMKSSKTFREILDMWAQEKDKESVWAYDGFETVCFFNRMGTEDLTKWLNERLELIPVS